MTIGPLDSGGFYVEDDGPGIPESQRQKVVEEGYTTVEEGSGTGFSIIMGVANRKGWDLGITDGADGGARVEIHNCPVVADPPPEPAATERVGLGQSDDVGDVGVEGSADYDGKHNRWIIEGGGTNIWQQENEFHFLHVPIHGAVRIEGRVTELDHNSQYSKAGFMVRDDEAEDAAYGYVGVSPSGGTELLWRNRRGDDGVSQHLEGVPPGEPWFRVDRRGETVTTYTSSDGEDWTALDQRRVGTTDPIEVGLVVCSHMPQTLASATFEDVSVRRLALE